MDTEKNTESLAEVTRREAEVEKLQARIEGLKADFRERSADVKLSAAEYLDELDKKKAALSKRLEDWKAAGGEAADDLKSGFEGAWEELSGAVNRARDHLNS